MEKRKPHCPLPRVLTLIETGNVRATQSALSGAAALGLDFADMIDVALSLKVRDFYKSMTSINDHQTWQDVYRPHTEHGMIYLKLTVIEDVVIISFKEL